MRWELPEGYPHPFAQERTHFPGPVRALDFALNIKAMEHGFNVALAEYGVPLKVIDLRVNGFVYEALVAAPVPALPPGEPRPSPTVLALAVDDLHALWEQEWLPEIQAHLNFWEGFDLASASNAALLDHVEATYVRGRDLWVLHFRMFFPTLVAISQFQGLAAEVLEDIAPDDVAMLLTGLPSQTTLGDDALWALGRRLHADPALAAALHPSTWPAVRAALAASPSGQALLADLEGYLAVLGRRASDWSIDRPFWEEDPSPVLSVLREYARTDRADRDAQRARREAARLALEEACHERITAQPHPIEAAYRRPTTTATRSPRSPRATTATETPATTTATGTASLTTWTRMTTVTMC